MQRALDILKRDANGFLELPRVQLEPKLTFSKNIFIPVTNACRNSCSYCSFRLGKTYLLSRSRVTKMLEKGRKYGCKEALFTLGERPESNKDVSKKLKKWGYSNISEYLYELCEISLSMKLLPHTNPGSADYEELKMLKEVNASMGTMLENASPRLSEQDMPHENSPGKHPEERIKVLEAAGKLKIPFTTGILVGIGETSEEIALSLEVIEGLNRKYKHIQEVIVQNFKPKKGTPMEDYKEPDIFKMIKVVRAAREVLTSPVQVPPNLNIHTYPIFVLYGASDFGGVSPVTKDYINPEAAWPDLEELFKASERLELELRERLPVYPKYIKERWYSDRVGEVINLYADDEGMVTGQSPPLKQGSLFREG